MDFDLLTAIAKFLPTRWLALKMYSRPASHKLAQICGWLLVGFFAAAHTGNAAAQGLDPAALLKPATDTWPTYNGDYSGRRHSPLKQINAANVKSLTLAWIFQAHSAAIKSTPLEVNGVLYFTVPDNVWAVDARTGRQLWHYEWKSKGGIHIGSRGFGMYR